MLLSERIGYGLAGGFLAAAIAMAIMFWTSYEHSSLLFKVLIPAGFVGGFIFGKQFYEFLSDLFSRIW
jgi:hypothetical protein